MLLGTFSEKWEKLIKKKQAKYNKVEGTDRLFKVVKLGMPCCGQILKDSFETYKTCPRFIITKFECKIDVQNHEFGFIGLHSPFFNY